MKDKRYKGVIKNSREGHSLGNPMERLVSKVDTCRLSLQTWSKLSFGNICRLLQQKEKLLTQVEALSMFGANHDQVQILKGEVYDLMVKEDCLW